MNKESIEIDIDKRGSEPWFKSSFIVGNTNIVVKMPQTLVTVLVSEVNKLIA